MILVLIRSIMMEKCILIMENKTALSKEDIELFYKLHGKLLFFVNERKKLFENIFSEKDLPKLGIENIIKIRSTIAKEPNLIKSFVSENPNLFSKEELQIVEKWKEGIYTDFYIVKYTKENTIFYSPKSDKCYGVLSLVSSFDEMFGVYLPIMVKAWLIPFKGKIIYDSLIEPYRISFGGGFRSGIKGDYEKSIVKNGIITSFEVEQNKNIVKEDKDEEFLRLYLRSQVNRDRYYEEIHKLRTKSPQLSKIYSQEMGKFNSRDFREKIRKRNISGWFAVLEDIIISSGKTEKELLKNLNEMLNKEMVESVHIFKI